MKLSTYLVGIAFYVFSSLTLAEYINVDYAAVPSNIEGIDLVDDAGFTALMLAAMVGKVEHVKNYIKGGANVNMTTAGEGQSALMLSARNGFYYTSIELIKAGASLDQTNRFGMTPLLLAIAGGYVEIVGAMLDAGANPDIAAADGATALMMAAQKGQDKMVQQLVKNNANTHLRTNSGETALMFAASVGHVNSARILLEAAAADDNHDIKSFINDVNDAGFTAMMLAASRGHSEVVELLIDHKADMNIRDELGRTALDHAISESNQSVINVLVGSGAVLPRSGFRVSSEIMRKRQLVTEAVSSRAKA